MPTSNSPENLNAPQGHVNKPAITLSFPYTQSHPTHLYSIAQLYGLNPKPVENARLLEIGCASGGNIIPMAYQFPDATFVGIDKNKLDIDVGTSQILDLNLKNVKLKHEQIHQFTNDEGKFDYIICHGLYSWSSPEIRQKILQICHENLSKSGIAYISYNTLPGWDVAGNLKDLLMWHTQQIPDPESKTQQAGALLKFILDTLENDNSAYAHTVKNEIHTLARHTSDFVINDYLSENNKAIYFHEFIDKLTQSQLIYVADAILPISYIENFPDPIKAQLLKINNLIYMNQYIDFVRNQRFRCSILCHNDQNINRKFTSKQLDKYYIQLQGRFENEDLNKILKDPAAEMVCVSPLLTLRSSDPNYKLALAILDQTRFKPMTYDKLAKVIFEKDNYPRMDEVYSLLNDKINLMQCAMAGMIQINAYLNPYITEITAKPKACPLARYFAKKQGFTTNRRHQIVALDPLSSMLLSLLDGEHTKADIVNDMVTAIQEQKLNLMDDHQQKITDPALMKEKVASYCDQILKNMTQQALLIG